MCLLKESLCQSSGTSDELRDTSPLSSSSSSELRCVRASGRFLVEDPEGDPPYVGQTGTRDEATIMHNESQEQKEEEIKTNNMISS